MSNTSDFVIIGIFGNFRFEFQDLQTWLGDTYDVAFEEQTTDGGGGTHPSPFEVYTLSVRAGTVATLEVIKRFRACMAAPQKNIALIVSDDERDYLDGIYV